MKGKYKISPIFVPNNIYNLTDWVPALNDAGEKVNSHSWFDINICHNPSINFVHKYETDTAKIPTSSFKQQMKSIRRRKLDKDPKFICTKKIRLYPTVVQRKILDEWFYAATKMYNITVMHIRKMIYYHGKLIEWASVDSILKSDFRYILKEKRDKIIASLNHPKTISHILDEAIQQAVSNHETCLTNLKEGHIKKFRIRAQSFNRRRYTIKIEADSFRNGSFCVSTFPSMKSSEPMTDIESTATLLYDRDVQKYILLVPVSLEKKDRTINVLDCGVDLGVRTFATAYSKANAVTIGNDLYQQIKKYHRKIDKINELLSIPQDQKEVFVKKITYVQKKIKVNGHAKIVKRKKESMVPKRINRSRLKKGLRKYHRKITDMVRDLHFKSAHYLVTNYDAIYIGKFSTKGILSRRNIKITKKTKRMVGVLAPYLFRERLKYMGNKYGCFVGEVKEYLSTKTCCNCGRINEIGTKKVHKCACGMKTDRDVCSGKTHLKLGYRDYTYNENDLELYHNTKEGVEIVYNKQMNTYDVVEV